MSERPDLDARMDDLRARRVRLIQELPTMDPLVGARAFSTLADEVEALAQEYEALLGRRVEDDDGEG